MRGVLPGRPDLRAVPAEQVNLDQRVNVALQPRMVPRPEWVTRARAQKAAGEEVTAPGDDEQDLVIGIRAAYIIPSELVPPQQWPAVGMDLEIEIGRVNLADLKARVHAHLEREGNALAAKVVPQRRAGQ